jgi:hypothetical protein
MSEPTHDRASYMLAKHNLELAEELKLAREERDKAFNALMALRDFMWSEGYADQTAVMRQADAALATPLGTPGSIKEAGGWYEYWHSLGTPGRKP